MKVLFLSHHPHFAHLGFAKTLNANIRILPLYRYTNVIKKYGLFGYSYVFFSLICSFFIPIKEDILFVEGGSSLYTAVFLKMRCKRLKIIYLDTDFFFYDLNKYENIVKRMAIKKIDGVISYSGDNKRYISKFLNVPIEVCPPYPQDVKKTNVLKKNYGLYIGRLDPEKKVKRIIDFGLQCHYFEKFIVIGDGILKKYVENISRKNKKLIYLGTKDNVGYYYNRCKFFIHLPDYEPYACTTMEAAICGCFPIISKGVGSKYLFDKLFIINNPDNFNEINQRIKYILGHEKEAESLLKKSVKIIPFKEETLKTFKNKFERIMKNIAWALV